jgi:predicted dehydrogenase
VTTLRAGLAGCGAAGRAAVAAVRRHSHCDIVAVCDPDLALAQSLQHELQVGFGTTQFEELLATGVDFVVLTGPCGRRLEQVRLACEQSVPMLLHAPMAPTFADAQAIVEAADTAEVRLGVLVPDMADPVCEQVRRMFADGWFGGLVAVHAMRADDDLLRHPPTAADPRLQAQLFGGDVLLRLAAADVHLATWLTGRSGQRVVAQASGGMLPLPHDHATALVSLRGNAQAVFSASHLGNGRTLAVLGTAGSVQIAGQTLLVRGERRYDGAVFTYDTPGRDLVVTRAELAAAERQQAPALELVGRFACWLEDLDGFPCPAEQALQDMRTVAAMQRALESGVTEVV